MARTGRPILLNTEIVVEEYVAGTDQTETVQVRKKLSDAFVDLLKVGHEPDDVCEAVGVDKTSYYNWMRMGRDAAAVLGEGGRDLTENEDDYLDFFHRATRARGHLVRRLEARLADLVPSMEPREVTDVLARLKKIRWAKASAMHVSGNVSVVETHGAAVGTLIRLVVEGLIEVAPAASRGKLREAAPGIVQAALSEVIEKPDGEVAIR